MLAEMLRAPGDEHYGLQLVRATGLKSGTLYPILRRLEEAGWVVGSWEEIHPAKVGRPARRFYQLTGEGARAARLSLVESARRFRRIPQLRTSDLF